MKKQYEAGTICFSVVDDSRKELLGDATGNRKIAIRLYYPVDPKETAGKSRAPYAGERKMAAIRQTFHLPKASMKNETDCYEAVPISTAEKFPLLLFNHGYNSYVEANTRLCTDLAANGFIVASIGHANESVENDYEDGSYDLFDKKINKMMYKQGVFKALRVQMKLMKKKASLEEIDLAFREYCQTHTSYITERIEEWVKDTLFVLEVMKERYSDYIDFSRGVAAGGHSAGGATAYKLCLECDEITCGLNIDGALFGDHKNRILRKPFYQFSCKENWNLESGVLLRKEAPVYTAIFSNMKHLGFIDIKFEAAMKSLTGTLPGEVMHSHLLEGCLFLLNRYLKGEEIPLNESHHADVIIEEH